TPEASRKRTADEVKGGRSARPQAITLQVLPQIRHNKPIRRSVKSGEGARDPGSAVGRGSRGALMKGDRREGRGHDARSQAREAPHASPPWFPAVPRGPRAPGQWLLGAPAHGRAPARRRGALARRRAALLAADDGGAARSARAEAGRCAPAP